MCESQVISANTMGTAISLYFSTKAAQDATMRLCWLLSKQNSSEMETATRRDSKHKTMLLTSSSNQKLFECEKYCSKDDNGGKGVCNSFLYLTDRSTSSWTSSYQHFSFFSFLGKKKGREKSCANECRYLGQQFRIYGKIRIKHAYTTYDCWPPPYKVTRKEGSKNRWTWVEWL